MPTDHGEVELSDVRVSADTVLGEVDRGLEVGQTFLHENRIRQAASSLGAAQYCIDRAVEYANDRNVFGKPLSVNQAVQWPLVELQTEAQMVRLLVYYAAPSWTATTTWRCRTRCRWPTTAPTGWCARPPTGRCRCSAESATAGISPSSTSTVITVATGSPRARRRFRSAEWRSGSSVSAASETRGWLMVLKPVIGEVRIENLPALTGGASRTTWAFDAVGDDGRQALILRTGPPDDVHAGMELEASAQQRAAAAGAPVPHILAADNSTAALGNPYLICNAIAGETIVRRIHRALDRADGAPDATGC